jgi:hypothetical protein
MIVTPPFAFPLACGVNETLMVQLAPPASEVGQLVVSAKGWLVARLLMIRLAPPVLVKVMVWGALVVPTCVAGNVRLVGDSETAAGVMPVPLRVTECGLPLALSVIVTAPFALPALCGVNVTLMVQLAPPESDAGQLLVCAKGWLAAMLLMLRLPPPELVKVTVCGALVVAMVWPENVRLAADKETAARVTPVPFKVINWGLP